MCEKVMYHVPNNIEIITVFMTRDQKRKNIASQVSVSSYKFHRQNEGGTNCTNYKMLRLGSHRNVVVRIIVEECNKHPLVGDVINTPLLGM